MSLSEHAKAELTRAGLFDKDSDYGGMIGDAVMKMIVAFAEEGHSGHSAHLALSIFDRLARFEPLTPLTGADDEWVDRTEESGRPMWQNLRASHVFKDADGAYDLNKGGARADMAIAFPYSPGAVS